MFGDTIQKTAGYTEILLAEERGARCTAMLEDNEICWYYVDRHESVEIYLLLSDAIAAFREAVNQQKGKNS